MKTFAYKFIAIILCIALSIVFFGSTAYAVASPSFGVGIPIGNLPADTVNAWDRAVRWFVDDLFGLTDERTINYDDTEYTAVELAQKTFSVSLQYCVTASPDDSEDPNIAFFLELSENYPEDQKDSIEYKLLKEFVSVYNIENNGNLKTNSEQYSDALKKAGAAILGSGGSDMFNFGVDVVNGVPQNVTTIKEDSYISVFDTLGLKYTLAPSILDFQFSRVFDTKDFPFLRCTPFFITSDNKLYVLNADVIFSSNAFSFYSFDLYNSTGSGNISLSYFPARVSFRFVDNSGHLYFCFHSSEYSSSYNTLYYTQYTFGSPSVSNAPFLFYDYRDGLLIPASAELSTDFKNYNISGGGVYFRCPVDLSNPLIDSDVLSADIVTFGCLQSNSDNIRFNSSTLETAAQMLLSSENVVSGGDKTITSELTDWQKAIYVLAQQQGISFEEMLKKLDLIIDSNGEITLLGLDGIEYSVSELSKKFDEIIGAVGDISGDLSKLLEYLKSLNLEGLDKYILSIESTLDDLNSRDKEKSAVLGDCAGTLEELKELMEGLSADVSTITKVITKIDVVELELTDRIDKFDPPSSITTKFPFSLPFDVYNIFNVLSADPVTPKFTIPFDFTSIGGEVYEINIDLSQFDYIANIVRWLLYGVFIIGLVLLTNKLIGRG